ncbi:DoxX family protein [Nocardioides sp. NPDC047086]|uniref:DoxX family protein n=1 Tax=Nocardioides sp. NPDC047086 TaxID=3154810 RepID=UPI0033E27687
MDVALWIIAGLLALVALAGGLTKTFMPLDKLAQHDGAAWTRGASPTFVRALGILEILAAIGLTLPAVFDVAPVLVPVTAACWIALMIGTMITHGRLGQAKLALVNVVYLALATFVVVGRFGTTPFTA